MQQVPRNSLEGKDSIKTHATKFRGICTEQTYSCVRSKRSYPKGQEKVTIKLCPETARHEWFHKGIVDKDTLITVSSSSGVLHSSAAKH